MYDCVVSGETSGYDVFLSYSRADTAAAETLRARLRDAGLTAFLDRYSLPAGQPWQPWLEQHLGACRALLALVGPNGLGEWQQREIQVGLSRQVSAKEAAQVFPVIPVLLPGLANDAVPIGRFLKLNTYVDLRAGLDDPEGLQQLVAGAQGKAIDEAAAEKLLAGLSPYRGLLPFREQDAGLFFGRKRFVDELVEKVRRRTDTNVVAVVGRSGSGKSSIVYAGLAPALRREQGVGGESVWQILALRPHDEPLHQLAAAFDPPSAEPGSLAYRGALNDGAKLLRERSVTLAELVRDRLRQESGSTRLLLYVDQWEELYTLAAPREIKTDADRQRAEDAKLFIDLVLDAAAASPCTLVLSVRSDFYPDLQSHDGLRVVVQENQVSLGTMNEAELRDVIDGPPKALGASVDPDLTKKLIRDIGLDPASGQSDTYDIGKLPLLEYALEQAWTKRTGPRIGLENYSGLEQALEERANALYGRLSTQEQAAAKRLFVSLVTPGEGREDTRARIAMPDDEAMRQVIQTFAGGDARLVVTDEAGGRRSVEVSHEALIRHWDRLRAWIDENRDRLRTREFLKANRAEWLKHGRDVGLLDLPSLYVEAARSLYQHPGDVVIDDVKDYVEALLDHERRRQEAEKAKQRAELVAARRRTWVAGAAAVLLLLVAVFAGREAWVANEQKAVAYSQTEEANRQKAIAEERTAEANKQKAAALEQKALADTERVEADRQKSAALQNESGALTALSTIARRTDPALATKLALAAWPRNGADPRPRLDVAIAALGAAVSDLRERRILRGHDGLVWSAAFSPDGARVVTASVDKTARVWDTNTGKAIAVLIGHDGPISSAAFSPDGARVVTASWDNTARVWDAATGKTIAVLSGHDDRVVSAAFSPDGARVVTASADKTARVWDAATGKAIAVLSGHDGGVSSAGFSPDGPRVVTASQDKTARVWDAATGKAIAVLSGHGREVVSAAFSPDGARVVTASDDKTARVWDAATGKAIAVLSGHHGQVNSAAFSPDSVRVVTASADNTARVWDAATGKAIAVLSGHDYPVESAAFSPDGARVVTASWDKMARVWDASTGKAIAVLSGHGDRVESAAFSPDSARVVTGSWDKTARVWDAATGKAIAVLSGHGREVVSAAFSPDGARVVTASDDKTARVWDAATGKAIAVLSGVDGEVSSAAFSPDGVRVVTASWDKTARLWDAATGKAIAVLSGHDDMVVSAAFSPDGAPVVTASWDKTARVWDPATGAAIAVLSGHDGEVVSAAFSPDGARVVTASEDKTARVWDVSGIPRGNLFQIACAWLPDHDLTGVAKDYGLTNLDPICEGDPPLPDPPP